MALAEAIAHGLPCVTTAGGAAAATFGSQAALLGEDDDDEALTHALKRIITESDLRSELAAAAIARARELPSWRDSSLAMHQVLSGLQRR
jgi:glycosyltransferase involved in cell wall biosynthesis